MPTESVGMNAKGRSLRLSDRLALELFREVVFSHSFHLAWDVDGAIWEHAEKATVKRPM